MNPLLDDLSTPEGRRRAAERAADAAASRPSAARTRPASRTLWRDPSLVRWLGTTPASPRARSAFLADQRLELVNAPEDAHLVSSLCTDGQHRPCFDCDYPVTATDAGDGQTFVTFDTTPDDDAWHHVRAFMREQGWVAVSERVNLSSGGRPSLLFNVPVSVIPSSTPGHFHLYIEAPLSWSAYRELLELVRAANIILGSTVPWALERGQTMLLKPGLSKARVRAQLELFDPRKEVG